jgi:long-chain fatty acid transport protein
VIAARVVEAHIADRGLRGANPTDDDKLTADAAQAAIGDVRLDYTGSDHGVGWNFGVLWRPLRWLSFGLSYNGATAAQFDGPVTVAQVDPAAKPLEGGLRRFAGGLGFKLPNALTVEMPIPHSLQAGVMFKLSEKVELGLDYRAWFYQVYTRQVIVPRYDPAEPGMEPLTAEALSRQKDYGLSYEIALGALFRPWTKLPGLELMVGISYDQSPIPSKYLSLDNPALNQLVFTVGARWAINRRWRVAFSYMGDKYLSRDVTNSALSPAMNLRGTGFAHIPRIEVEYMRW